MSEWESIESSSFPKKWKLKSLDQYMQEGRGICYGIVQPGFPDESGIPVIRVNNLRSGRIVSDDVLKVSAEIESQYSRSRLRGNEILISLVGNVGEIVIVDSQYQGWNVARAIGVIPINDDIDKIWLKYWLQSAQIQQYIKTRCNTTVQITLNLKDVSTLPILEPSLEEQRLISSIPFALDRKIFNLRQQNETLERIAQSLFKHWFVDFEFPNEDGKPYKSSGGEMVRSELGEIPTSWRVEPLDEVANFLNGLALQNYPAKSENFLPVIKIREMKSGITANTEKASSELPSQYVIDNGDVIFSWSGSLEIIIWCLGKGALNQHLFKVSSEKYPKWFYYFWNLEHLKHFRAIAKSKATTMGHIQRKHLSEALCCVPSDSRLQVMNFTMTPILEKTIQNSLQIQTLAKTRDVLLPKLMSGKLRITAS